MKIELTKSQNRDLRLWCMSSSNHRMYELHQWLINSNSIEELEFKKKVYLLTSRNFQAGTFQEQYLWITTGVIPSIAIETFIEPLQS